MDPTKVLDAKEKVDALDRVGYRTPAVQPVPFL